MVKFKSIKRSLIIINTNDDIKTSIHKPFR